MQLLETFHAIYQCEFLGDELVDYAHGVEVFHTPGVPLPGGLKGYIGVVHMTIMSKDQDEFYFFQADSKEDLFEQMRNSWVPSLRFTVDHRDQPCWCH